ncbi:hypothetical protein ABIB38_004843 [Massilia sp. UYP11]|uniref:helix-turn-helix transcriptional regulator n=1 Tax=Massilia sp. UYP11 TaxID=1756385 RepID=UPI003D250B95
MTPDEFLFKLQNLPPDVVLTATHLVALLQVLKPTVLNATAQVVDGNFDTYPNSKIIGEEELGSWIGEAISTLQKWRVSGKGPKFIKKPKNIGYRVGDVKDWLDTLTVSSTAESHVRLNRLDTVFSSPMPFIVPTGDRLPLPFFQSLHLDNDEIEAVVLEYVEHFDRPEQNLPAWLYSRLAVSGFAHLYPQLEEFIEGGADINHVAKRIFGQEVIEFSMADLMAEHEGSDPWYKDTLLMLLANSLDISKIEGGSSAFQKVVELRNLNKKLDANLPTKSLPRRDTGGKL